MRLFYNFFFFKDCAKPQSFILIFLTYNPIETFTIVVVLKQDATVDIKMPSNMTVGDNVTVEVKLPADAIGNVTLKVDGIDAATSSVVNGSANLTLSGLSAGNHTVEIAYSGDDNYSAANATGKITVLKKKATVDIEIPSNMTVGDNSTVEVKLPADAIGNVTLKVDGSEVSTAPVIDGSAILTLSGLSAGNHTVEIAYSGDDNYSVANATGQIAVSKKNADVDITVPSQITVGDDANVNVKLPGDATGNVTVSVDGIEVATVAVSDGTAGVKLPGLAPGKHSVEISYSGDNKYNPQAKTATVTVNRQSSSLAAANVSTTYNVNKNLVITLTDANGNPVANEVVEVVLNSDENYTTDENGSIEINVAKLVPKTYTAKITFKGNENMTGSSTTAGVVVKKATPKISAKAKSFKTTVKTKRYSITLKDNKGKAIKNAKVTLKVKGRTYKATTNSRGKATFKITKLTKKGTYKAVITYKGNDYYKKVTKKVKISVKPAWKTVARGSKLKETVKKIQKALKNNGYYITYKGHYLMVDGFYGSCTERSVKEFQTDNSLKVTGKVNEKTAIKLKLI